MGSYYPAQSGGPNNTIHWQAKYLSKEGVDVSVVSLKTGLTQDNVDSYNIQLNSRNKIEGVSAYYFDYFLNRYFSFKFYIWLIFNIKKFDFVQLTSYFFPITWFGALICNINNIPFSIAPRGELEDNALIYNRKTKQLVQKLLLNKLYKNVRFLMVTSQQELKFSKRYFHNDTNFEIVPNYIDISENKSMTMNEILEKKGILYLGRVHPKKGLENLIKAYIMLSEDIKQSHSLFIAGGGNSEYVKKLKDMAHRENRIFFLGHKEGNEKKELYEKNRIFVLPSFSENFGNVVLESLSYSTPVIASKFTPWQELEKEKCGFWVDNIPVEIKNKLEHILLMSDNDYSGYAKNSFDFVYRKYDINHNIKHLVRIYAKYEKKE